MAWRAWRFHSDQRPLRCESWVMTMAILPVRSSSFSLHSGPGCAWSGRCLILKTLSFVFLVCLSILIPAFAPALHAQKDAKNDRKLLARVEPVYPPTLKMRQIGGTVRLEVTISPAGKVEDVAVLGGNPILAQAAVTAVKKWKYAPADSRTTAEVKIDFNPYR